MKLAIMQPYIFPYIGYYQLIHSVDKIVMYDDVNFIKQGWINRNRILLDNKDFLFTVPLADASSFRTIKKTYINNNIYNQWKKKFLTTLTLAYKKAPLYRQVYPIIETILDADYISIADLARESLKDTCSFIGISTQFINSSSIYGNENLKGQERVIDICSKEGANVYNNAIGGKELYSKEEFEKHQVSLKFVKPNEFKYDQFNKGFIPHLSIIDAMMFNEASQIQELINNYDLI
jgi:hypothetical protein